MINTLLHKLRMRRRCTTISIWVTLVGVRGIVIGSHCKVDPFCYLKSEKPNGRLVIGNHVVINRFSHISAKGSQVRIEDYSYIGYNNWIGGQGSITIGHNFISGMNLVMVSSNHDYYNVSIPYHRGEEIEGDILVGDSVWIGANSVVLPGISIGSGAVVAAGSIVTKDVPPHVVVAGNPAEVVKQIDRKLNNRTQHIT